ncbi:hypothetical protein FBU30_006030 [Linnemannia zychae]|nr:hypothetical protein FBU30_006030 [Linnemannia zychae]
MTEDNAPLSSNDAILTSADYLNSLALNQAQLALPQLSTHQSYPGLRHQLSGEVFYPNISQEQHHSTVAWSLVPSSTPFSLFSRESSNAASDLSFSFDQSPSLYSKLAPTLSTNVFSQQWPKQLRYTSVQSNSLFPKTEMPIFCQNSALSSNTFPDLRFPVYTITTQNQTEAHPTELCHSSSMNSAKSFMEYQQQERRSPALYPRVSFKTSRYKVDRGMATDPVTIPLPLSRIKSGILQKVRSIKQERQRRQWRLYRRIQRHRRCKRHILKRRMNVGTIDENHYKYGTLSKSHVSLLLPRKVCRKTPREVMEYLRTDAFMEEAVRSTILDQNKSMSGIKEECRAETHEEKTATPFIGSASRTTLSSSAATDAETDRIVYHGLLARIVNIDLNNIHKTEELLKIFKLKLLASILLQKHHDATDAVQNNLSDAQIIELASNKVISDVYPFGEDAYLTKSLDPRTSKILDDLLWGKSRISIPKPSAINVFTVKVPDQTPEGGSTTNEPISSPAPLSLSSPSTTNNGVTANANLSLSFVSQSVIGVPTTHDSTTMQESVATIITHQPFDSPVISTIPFATPASVSDSTSTGSIPETTVVSAINTPSLNSPQSDQVVPSIVDKSRSGTLPNSILASSQFQREKSSRPHVEFNQTRFTRYFFKSEEPERISFAKSDGVYTAGPPDEEPLIDNEGSTWRADQTVAITRRKQQSKTECKARMREELYDEEDKIVEDEIKKQEERDRRRQVVEGTADKIDEVELLDPVEEAQRQLWIKEKLEQQRIRREDQKKQREKEEQEEQKIQQEQVEQGEEEHREKEKQDQRRRIKEKLSVTALLEPSPILIPTSISTFISNISSQHPTSPPDVVLKQDLDSTIYNKTLEEEEALQEIWLAEQRQKAHEENRVCQPRAQKSSNLSIHVPLFRPTHHDDSSFSRTAMEREESEEVQREEIEKEELKKTIELSLTEYQQSRTSRVINKGKQVVRNTQHHPSQHYAGEKETGYYYKDYSDSMSHYNASEGSQRHWYADQRRLRLPS